MNPKSITFIAAVLLLSLGLSSCERTKIGDITADPGRFRDKQVDVAGEVVTSVGASILGIGRGVYEISDGTGTLWVYSEHRSVPTKGARVAVKGHISESVTIMGKNYGTVLREDNRYADKAEKTSR